MIVVVALVLGNVAVLGRSAPVRSNLGGVYV